MDVKNDVVVSRVFNAPRKLVWKAWTDPEHLMRWWGPKDFTSPTCKMDFRVGEKYLYCMRSPDGQDILSNGIYLEIVPMEKIVWTDSFSDEKGNVIPPSSYGMADDFPIEVQATLLFEDVDGKTRFTLRHVGIPPGEMKEMTAVGWNESLDNLAETFK